MKNSKILVMMLTVLAFAACQKEDNGTSLDGRLVFKIEGNDNTKTTITHRNDSSIVAWVTGDSVRINDKVLRVVYDDGTASAANPFDGMVSNFYAVYPSTLCNGAVSSSVTLNLPAEYTYAVSDGKQNLKTPMVAYAPATAKELVFKHVTAAIGVKVVNYYGFTIEVDEIEVISNKYKLNGDINVTLGPSDLNVTAIETANDAEKKVKMTGGTSLRIFAGDSAIIQVPVLPVGNDNQFTIRTHVHKVDQPAVDTTFVRTQGTSQGNYALGRAKIGYARFATPGLFSVSASKKVVISQGNLQYQASTGTWKFSETQYGYIGNGNENIADDYSGWIDLFGWATSGWNNTASDAFAVNYHPYSSAHSTATYSSNPTSAYQTNRTGYGPSTTMSDQSLIGTSANYDWGVHNAISNGGNVSGRWNEMSKDEFSYLLNTRTVTFKIGYSVTRYIYVNLLGSYHGIVLLPDNYVHPDGVTTPVYGSSGWSSNAYSESDWLKMEAAGAVFLPAAGIRTGETCTKVDEEGYYWTTTNSANTNAHYYTFSSSTVKTSNTYRYTGYSVRLVRDVE